MVDVLTVCATVDQFAMHAHLSFLVKKRNRPPTGPLLWECFLTDSWPFAMPTASRAALGAMATLSTGDGYFDTCVTLNASNSYTCSPKIVFNQSDVERRQGSVASILSP